MSKVPPTITIVTPTFNQASYIEETVESILAQDFPNIEYVVINDGSTDGTAAILERYSTRISVINHANIGQARTLNKGWNASTSKYLSYLSSDDKLRPCAISRLIAVLEEDDSIVCAFPDSDLIDENSRVVKQGVCREFDLADLVIRQECYIGPGAVFRASAFKAAGGWRPELRLAPDREFWMRLANFGSFAFVNESLAEYRLHRESISYKDVSEAISAEYIHVLNDYFSKDDIRPDIKARISEAFGYAELVVARNLLRSGQIRKGLTRYRQARRHHSALGGISTQLQLLRSVVSKPLRAAAARAMAILK